VPELHAKHNEFHGQSPAMLWAISSNGIGDVAELKVAVRQNIASGVLPRIEDAEGQPSVAAIGRQAS